MAQEDKLFKAPEQKKAEEKPVEAQKEEDEAKEKQHERVHEQTTVKPAKGKEAKASEPEEKKREIVVSRIVTASLGDAYKKPFNRRGNAAVRLLREQIARGFKVKGEAVKISPLVSNLVFARSSRSPPRHLKLACSLDKEGVVVVESA